MTTQKQNPQAVVATPFEQAKKMEKRLKLLLFGDYGEGKTWLALHFPKPVIIDMERGADLYGDKLDFGVMRTVSPDEIFKAVEWMLTNKHNYKTVIIDPISVYWEAVQQKWMDIYMRRNPDSAKNKKEYWDMQFSDWGPPKSEFLKLLRFLSRLDMNVIVTAGIKPLYSSTELMKKIGDTFDGPKELPRFFDTTVRLTKAAGKYYGTCEDDVLKLKDRSNLLPKGLFELTGDPYKVFRDSFGDILEKDSEPIVLIKTKQRGQIEGLCVALAIGEEKLKKSLLKYKVAQLDELTESEADEIIQKLETTLKDRKETK